MIEAIVLAAGLSQRMGRPKMVLPWGRTTVIDQVVDRLSAGGIHEITVVTGGTQQMVKEALRSRAVHFVNNPDYANGEMLTSLQAGLKAIKREVEAILMVLGDQPQLESATVRVLSDTFTDTHSQLILPSYRMHRGHPWLIGRSLWDGILKLQPPATLRDFLKQMENEIRYVVVDSPSVLKDLDTPEDYHREKPPDPQGETST